MSDPVHNGNSTGIDDDLIYAGLDGGGDDDGGSSGDGSGVSIEIGNAEAADEPNLDDFDPDDVVIPDGLGDEDTQTQAGQGKDGDGDDPDKGKAGEANTQTQTTTTEEDPEQTYDNLWDKERQKRDQEHAAERKALQQKNSDLEAEVEKLRAQSTQTRKPEEPATKTENKSDFDSAMKDWDEAVAQLSDDPTTAEYNNVLSKVPALVKAARTSGEKAAVEAIGADLAEIKNQLAESKAQASQAAEAAAQKAANDEFQNMLKGFDEKYGDHLHNDAYKAVQTKLAAKGIDQPSLDLLESMFEVEYMQLSAKNPKRTRGGKKPPAGKVPAVDPGSGGSTTRTKPKTGTLDEVADDMFASGAFK